MNGMPVVWKYAYGCLRNRHYRGSGRMKDFKPAFGAFSLSFEFFSSESFHFWKIIWSICGHALITTDTRIFLLCMSNMLRVGKNIHDFDIKSLASERKKKTKKATTRSARKKSHLKKLQRPDTINIYDPNGSEHFTNVDVWTSHIYLAPQ